MKQPGKQLALMTAMTAGGGDARQSRLSDIDSGSATFDVGPDFGLDAALWCHPLIHSAAGLRFLDVADLFLTTVFALELFVPAQGARPENPVRADTRLTADKISNGHTGQTQADRMQPSTAQPASDVFDVVVRLSIRMFI